MKWIIRAWIAYMITRAVIDIIIAWREYHAACRYIN